MVRAIFLTAVLAASQQAGAESVVLSKSGLTVRVQDSPEATRIDGDFAASSTITLRIDWLNRTPAPTDFKTAFANGIATSTHTLGTTRITRTVLVSDDAVFIHFLADKPGDLSFRATLQGVENGGTLLENRRELAWTATEKAARKARAWVIPFESDVESDGNSIVLRGEGECLVLLDFTDTESPAQPISTTWARISAAYDPGENPPDPVKIWQAVLAKAAAR
jgi:hypothetical protein